MAILEGKKAIIIGDRDGIPGPAIAECVKTAGLYFPELRIWKVGECRCGNSYKN